MSKLDLWRILFKMASSLVKTVLTQRNSNGDIKANIPEYYERYIKPLEPKYKDSVLTDSRKAICPLPDHNDTDPSFGLTNHKFYKGVKIYHCFGCGGTGTIIRLHQRIQHKYYNKNLTEDESALELAKIFDIDLSKVDDLSEDNDKIEGGYYMRNSKALRNLEERYTIRDYQSELRGVRVMRETSNINTQEKMINRAIIKMIATGKNLYD